MNKMKFYQDKTYILLNEDSAFLFKNPNKNNTVANNL